ncbi:MAG: YciI family protein [Dehalococcoidia bacterium]
MRYLALIYTNEATDAKQGTPEAAARYAGYEAFGQEATRRGVLRGGERLRPVADARTVRVRDGKAVTVDGPFAETKEQLGGYYMLECATEAEAIELAAMIPGAKDGSIELRPIWDM